MRVGPPFALGVLLGCAPVPRSEEPASPTEIGASEALQAEEREVARGYAGAALARIPEADLTTEEGREVLSFSAATVMGVGTSIVILSAVSESPRECFDIRRSERDGTARTEVRSEGCRDIQPGGERRHEGTMVIEQRETECGQWQSLTLRSWTIRDERPCGRTGAPKGVRVYQGRVVIDECQETMEVDLVLGGEGLEELHGECRPIRAAAIRYRLGKAEGRGEQAPMNGEGEVGIAGAGRALIETVEERIIGRECRTEAASGITRARAGGHVAEVRYDGAGECTDPGRAPLFVDGQPAGTTEYACAAGGSGPAPFAPLLILLAFRRRR